MAHATEIHKKKPSEFDQCEQNLRKKIGGRSVLAIDHKKNEIQRPRTVSHAR